MQDTCTGGIRPSAGAHTAVGPGIGCLMLRCEAGSRRGREAGRTDLRSADSAMSVMEFPFQGPLRQSNTESHISGTSSLGAHRSTQDLHAPSQQCCCRDGLPLARLTCPREERPLHPGAHHPRKSFSSPRPASPHRSAGSDLDIHAHPHHPDPERPSQALTLRALDLRRPPLRWHRTRRVGIITLEHPGASLQDQKAPTRKLTTSQETQQAVSISTATRRSKPPRTAKIHNWPYIC